MNTAIINIKTNPETKMKAQKVADEMGLSLSALINAFLKDVIKKKTVTFNAKDEVPNARTRAILKKAEENLKTGNHSPLFKTGEEAVAWLEKQGV
ncbi:MAG: type II toxin-antitoxin system RelB/DinJ family antitoxin [Candidatus Levyibacteriota bacterium]